MTTTADAILVGVRWYEQVLQSIVGIMVLGAMLGLPAGVVYAAYRWRKERVW